METPDEGSDPSTSARGFPCPCDGGTDAPSAASAEAGCNDGENTGATRWLSHSEHFANENDAWRYYARLTPVGKADPYSVLSAFNSSYQIIGQDMNFNEFAGFWDTGHYPQLVDRTVLANHTGLNRYYFYKRSCMK